MTLPSENEIRCRCGGLIVQQGTMWRCGACHRLVAKMALLSDVLKEAQSGPIDPEFGTCTHAQPPGIH